MFPAGATAEILTRDNDLGTTIRVTIQHKIGDFATILGKAHLIEQIRPETGSFDGLQELLRDNHIRIDIENIERCRNACQPVKFLHLSVSCQPCNSRISVR